VRALIDDTGLAKAVRAEQCPSAAKRDAEANVQGWEWPPRPGKGDVQSVFPAPIFVRRGDAQIVPARNVLILRDGKTEQLPRRVSEPPVYIHAGLPPDWGSTHPTGACYVDVDLDDRGIQLKVKWVSGEIEVSGRVFDALESWKFFPVIIQGERTPVRVRLSMCDY
jgi:hypothetical protein